MKIFHKDPESVFTITFHIILLCDFAITVILYIPVFVLIS